MALNRYVDVIINNKDCKATLKEPLIVFEKDKNAHIYFRLVDYRYQYKLTPATEEDWNIIYNLNGADAWITIVKPNGTEVEQGKEGNTVNNVILKDAYVRFILSPELTDEIDEIGIYQLQIHITDKEGGEVTIPSFSFEVKERLKGISQATAILLLTEDGNNLTTEQGVPLVTSGNGVTISSLPPRNAYTGSEYMAVAFNGITYKMPANLLKSKDGTDGKDGVTPTIRVGKVNTLPAGTNATVTATTSNNVITLDFGIPRGADGSGGSGSGHNHTNLTELEKFETGDKAKLDTAATHAGAAHAPSNAEQNVQSDWNVTDTSSDAYIKNKPAIPAVTQVVDNLTSTDTNKALSANQGKVLDEKVATNASSIAEITNQQATDLSLTGTTLKLKKSDGTTIGNGVTLPSSGGGGVVTDLTGYQTNGSSIGKKGARSTLRPLISFSDDDGNVAVMSKWLPIIQSKNIPITLFIVTDVVGSGNTLTWEQLKTLQDDYGCEIASHTLNHTLGATKKDFRKVLKASKEKLMANGLKVNGFAYPSGSYYVESVDCSDFCREQYDYAVITQSNKNTYPITNSMKLDRGGIGSYDEVIGSTLDEWKAKVDDVYTNGGWFIFMTHIGDKPGGHTDQDTTNIGLLIDYIKSKNIDIVTIREGYEIYGNALETPSTTITNQGKIISQDVNVTVPPATKATAGIVKIGDGIEVTDGIISVDNALYYNKSYLDGIFDGYESRITALENNSGGSGNTPPIVSTIENIKVAPSKSFAITYTAVDSDGILTHELSTDNGANYNTISPTANGNTFTYTTSITNIGVYYYKLRVTDTLGAITVKSFSVTVEGNKIILTNSKSANADKVKDSECTYFVNGTGGWNEIRLFDTAQKLVVDNTYTACFELIEDTLNGDYSVTNRWESTQDTESFVAFNTAEVGKVVRADFTYYATCNDSSKYLICVQSSNEITSGTVKFKLWLE